MMTRSSNSECIINNKKKASKKKKKTKFGPIGVSEGLRVWPNSGLIFRTELLQNPTSSHFI